jgi:hypothetical protein
LSLNVFAFFRDKEELYSKFSNDCQLKYEEKLCFEALSLMSHYYNIIEKTEISSFKRNNFGDRLVDFSDFKRVVECCGCHITLRKVVYNNGQKVFTKEEIDDLCLFKNLIDDEKLQLKLACKDSSEADFSSCKEEFHYSQSSHWSFFDSGYLTAGVVPLLFALRRVMCSILPGFSAVNSNIPCGGCNGACGGI